MITKILVPLDGSPFSEQALEPAMAVARKFDASIVLLRVLAPELDAVAAGMSLPYSDLGNTRGRDLCDEAEAYLCSTRAQWLGAGVSMTTRTMTGSAPEKIAEAAVQVGADLIVMSTHGRTGFSRLLYGSVAEAVLRGTRLPLMLIPIK